MIAFPVRARCGALAFALTLSIVGIARAQLSDMPKRCARQARQDDDAPYREVIVDRIDFDGPIHLSDADISEAAALTERDYWDADKPEWVDELAEGLTDAWQNRGYFHASVTAKAASLGGNSSEEHFFVTAHVNEGLEYHLGGIRFKRMAETELSDGRLAIVQGKFDLRGMKEFSEIELRDSIPIRDGEIFSVAKIRQGIDALTRLYESRGYIDFTAAPDTEVDDNLQRISLTMVLDLQKQFRVGRVDIAGLDSTLEAGLRSIVRTGDIFNPYPVAGFLTDHQELLLLLTGLYPTDGYEVKRNVRTGIADLTFDFRSCASPARPSSGAVVE